MATLKPTKDELKKLTLDAVWDGLVIGGLVVMVPMCILAIVQLLNPAMF